ncbi:hypothetical protein ADL27_40855, partial [Streptomyces sp. NRRL F-6602]
YGALRYLRAAEPGPAGDRARALAASPAPELAFNYLGHFGTADDSGWARSLVLNPGGEHDPGERRGHVLEVVGAVQDGRLTFTWAYSGTLHERATVAALAVIGPNDCRQASRIAVNRSPCRLSSSRNRAVSRSA